MTRLKNSNCDKTIKKNSNCDKTQTLKLWQNLNYDKSQFMRRTKLNWSFSKNILTPWQLLRCSLGSVLQFFKFFFIQVPTFFFVETKSMFSPQKICSQSNMFSPSNKNTKRLYKQTKNLQNLKNFYKKTHIIAVQITPFNHKFLQSVFKWDSEVKLRSLFGLFLWF